VHLSALSPRYRAALEGAATALRSAVAAVAASRGRGIAGSSKANAASPSAASPAPSSTSTSAGSALVLNLGPAWSSASAYSLFDDAVIELPFRDWEGPPGLCSPPLDVLFAVAEATSKWLSTSPDAVALLCVRARSGGGAATARLVAACQAVFNVDAGSVEEALSALPPPPPRARGWSTFFVPTSFSSPEKEKTSPRQAGLPPLPPRDTGGSHDEDATKSGSNSSSNKNNKKNVFSGPAQARYGAYFDGLLHSSSLEELEGPQATMKRLLRAVSIRGFEALDLAACSSSVAGSGGGGGESEAGLSSSGLGAFGLAGGVTALTGSLTDSLTASGSYAAGLLAAAFEATTGTGAAGAGAGASTSDDGDGDDSGDGSGDSETGTGTGAASSSSSSSEDKIIPFLVVYERGRRV